MRMRQYFVFSILALVLMGFIYVFIYNMQGMGSKKEYTEISMIVRGRDGNSYETVKQGADQAANDWKAEVSFITLSEENNAEEQKKMMERELNNGAKAIILSAADSEEMKEAVEQIADKIPVITIESTVNSDKVRAHIGANDLEMGKSIAVAVGNKVQKKKKIIILENGTSSEAIQERRKGVEEQLAEEELYASVLEIDNNMEVATVQIKEILEHGKANIFIALDATVLETTAAFIMNENKEEEFSLYGIGVTPKIASFLEKGVIDVVVAPNDFNIGYLGVKAAMNAVEKKGEKNTKNVVEFMAIQRENMYEPESERLLFPFVR